MNQAYTGETIEQTKKRLQLKRKQRNAKKKNL